MLKPMGSEPSKPSLSLYSGKHTLQTHGLDKYRRTIADVRLLDGTHVNHTLVKDGWCWWYRRMRQAKPLTLLVKM
jgi:endonuclease YncB( thermonuclease family)